MKTGNEILRIRRKRFSALLTVLMMLLDLMPGFSLADDDTSPALYVGNVELGKNSYVFDNDVITCSVDFEVEYSDESPNKKSSDQKKLTVKSGTWLVNGVEGTGSSCVLYLRKVAGVTFITEHGYVNDKKISKIVIRTLPNNTADGEVYTFDEKDIAFEVTFDIKPTDPKDMEWFIAPNGTPDGEWSRENYLCGYLVPDGDNGYKLASYGTAF